MKIGLIDIDGHAKKKKWGATIYPNLALCKVASYHRAKGDTVEWYDGMFGWGFPTQKSALDEMINEELNVEYVKDENGELLLDEEGNPIPENGGGSIGWGDWEYTYPPCTREEIDTVLALAETARPISLSNQEILKIIGEEAQAYYKGDKSAADVAALIQSRLSVYVSENS